jgi:hypothetical protein
MRRSASARSWSDESPFPSADFIIANLGTDFGRDAARDRRQLSAADGLAKTARTVGPEQLVH